MRKRFLFIAVPICFCAASLQSLETKPWLGDLYAFELSSQFLYSQFSKVQGAGRQLETSLHDRDLIVDLGWTPFASADVQFEAEFAQTNTINWGLRSGAMQLRFQMLDDISGDAISLVGGLTVRGASCHFLRSVSTPYAAPLNVELTCAAGKEWSRQAQWTSRAYGLVAVGQGNQGLPWTRACLEGQYHYQQAHQFSLFLNSLMGFGSKQHPDVLHFKGWGSFQHQSVDVGTSYGYQFGVFGLLKASYAYRVFAHHFPERVNFFMLSYTLPFSLF